MSYHLKTRFTDNEVTLSWGRYTNGRKALGLIDVEDGSPVMVATVNIPMADLSETETIIKDYSENEGVLKFLQENGIVGPVKREIPTGFVRCPVVDILIGD